MQPTFLPWIGYFGLMQAVDEFVLLDHVAFDKRSWQQRNRIKTPAGPLWLTAPVITKGLSGQPINEVMLQKDSPDFPGKMIKTIEHNCKKASFYSEYAPAIIAILEGGHDRLCDLNIALIAHFRDVLRIATPLVSSSSLGIDGKKAGLLAAICMQRGADHYFSPPGAKDYIDASDDFAKANIKVSFFTYDHPVYNQLHGAFEPYMSIIDLVFNVGPESLAIIRKGIKHETAGGDPGAGRLQTHSA